MKKIILIVIISLFYTGLFSQTPFAQDYSFYYYIDCNQSNNLTGGDFLNNINSPNGINYASVDLDFDMPGVQQQVNINGRQVSFYLSSNVIPTISIETGDSLQGIQFQYTYNDNLGNTSNIGTVSTHPYTYVHQELVDSLTTCEVPTGVINFSPNYIVDFPYTLNLYRYIGSQYSLFSTQIITSYSQYTNNILPFTDLPAGYYYFELITSCGQIFSSYEPSTNNQLIREENPLIGTVIDTYVDYNNNGIVDVGDVINYQISITNTSTSCVMNDVGVNYNTSSSPTVPTILPGETNSSLTRTRILTQSNINSGSVLFHHNIISSDLFPYPISFESYIHKITPLDVSDGIKLVAFNDSNNNGIQEGYESNYTNGTFNYKINNNPINYLNSSTGEVYLYETNPLNVYDINFDITSNNNYCGSQNSVSVINYPNITVANNSGITTYKFPVVTQPCNDLEITLLNPSGNPIVGNQYVNVIKITNNGNQVINSILVTFIKDSALSILQTSTTVNYNNDGFTKNLNFLNPGQSTTIIVTMQVPTLPTVSLGQTVTNFVSVTPNDSNQTNNSQSLTEEIRGSYDPNDKQETHGGRIVHSTFTSNDYLTYTIRFENTGTAEAINVRINDVLDSKLNPNTIKMIAASHPYVLQRTGTELNWKFDGINLPPSVPNTQIGHGYITFQIKPTAGYAIGDIIPNFASIYFDFNPPIITNTHLTEFVATLSNQNFAFNDLNYYPNPVKNSLSISNASLIEEIEITSLLGQRILTKKINELQTELNLSELSNGIYFVKVISEGQEKTVKIIKE